MVRGIVAILFFSVSAYSAELFPEGNWCGDGVKYAPGASSVPYQVRIEVRGNDLDFRYFFPGAAPVRFALVIKPEAAGYYIVNTPLKGDIGRGYCGPTGCHYEVTLGEGDTEEWTWVRGRAGGLFKVGSRSTPQRRYFWEESLSACPTS